MRLYSGCQLLFSRVLTSLPRTSESRHEALLHESPVAPHIAAISGAKERLYYS